MTALTGSADHFNKQVDEMFLSSHTKLFHGRKLKSKATNNLLLFPVYVRISFHIGQPSSQERGKLGWSSSCHGDEGYFHPNLRRRAAISFHPQRL